MLICTKIIRTKLYEANEIKLIKQEGPNLRFFSPLGFQTTVKYCAMHIC